MKKMLSILLAFALCFSVCAISVSAAPTTADLELTVENVKGVIGEEVTVNINLTQNSGFSTLSYFIDFDKSQLELISVEKVLTLPSNYTNVHVESDIALANTQGSFKTGFNPAPVKDPQGNPSFTVVNTKGVIAKVKFKVKTTATLGLTTAVTLRVHTAAKDTSYNSYDYLSTNLVNGGVKVICKNHTWGTWQEKIPAKCETDGEKERTCSACFETEKEPIFKLGHDYADWVIVDPAECDKDGERTKTCRNDATHIIKEDIPATGHAYSAWNVTVTPTETQEGEREKVCANDATHKIVEQLLKVGEVVKDVNGLAEAEAEEGTYLPKDTAIMVADITENANEEQIEKDLPDDYKGKSFLNLYAVGLIKGSDALIDLNGGNVIITLKAPTNDKFTNIVPVIVKDDKLVKLEYEEKDGNIIFKTNSSENFIIFVGDKKIVEVNPGEPGDKAPEKEEQLPLGDNPIIPFALVIVLISAAALIVTKKSKNNA